MKRPWFWLLWIGALAHVACALLQARSVAGPQDDQLGQQIQKLGSTKYAEREKAQRSLEAIGARALDELRKAIKDNDPEISLRCRDLVGKLEHQLAAAAILVPKKINLKIKDTPVSEAVQELARQSGYEIRFSSVVLGSLSKSTERKVTLETGEVGFWQAFDKLCQAGNLVEEESQASPDLPYTIFAPPPPPLAPLPPAAPPQGALPPPAPPAPLPFGQRRVIRGQGAQGQIVQIIRVNGGVLQWGPNQCGPGFLIGAVANDPFEQPSVIRVHSGAPHKIPTSYQGATRVRLLPGSQSTSSVAHFTVEVTAEPQLRSFSVRGVPRVDVAIDDKGQRLTKGQEPPPADGPENFGDILIIGGFDNMPFRPQHVDLRLQLGPKRAKTLTSLSGSVAVEAFSRTPEPLLTMDEVMQSGGKTVKGLEGGYIEVIKIDKEPDSVYRVHLRYQVPQLAMPTHNALLLQMQMLAHSRAQAPGAQRGMPLASATDLGLPVLVTADGKELTLEQIPQMTGTLNSGLLTQDVTLIFRAGPGIGPPTRMVLMGRRWVTTPVGFHFEDVGLSRK